MGSDSSQGLTEGYKLLKQASASQGSVLLITASNPTDNSWSVAKTIAEQGGHVNVLAMLENNVNTQTTITRLQQLAKTGNGVFYLFTANTEDIENIVKAVGSKQVINAENMENADQWLDAGPWFCLLLIPIALWILRENMRHAKN
jgi:DNA-binding NarL/FixJ family response regulator